MSSLLAFALYDTSENKRTEITRRCLQSLKDTVDLKQHRLFLIDNASCQETKDLIQAFVKENSGVVITNDTNLGTAEAINIAWMHRDDDEFAIKCDNDVVWHQKGWVEQLEECIQRDPSIGIAALKRKDCWENVMHEDPDYKSTLLQLPHVAGQRWIVVEKVKHAMGTVQMYNPELLHKMGYLFQNFSTDVNDSIKYGWDDVFASWRSKLLGFKNVFLPHIEIDHIDPGDTPYQTWKEKIAGEKGHLAAEYVREMIAGTKPIYYNPFLTTQP